MSHKNICCSLSWHLFHTLPENKKPPPPSSSPPGAAATSSSSCPSSSSSSSTQVVLKNPRRYDKPVFSPLPPLESELAVKCWGTTRTVLVVHKQNRVKKKKKGLCADVRSRKGREQLPQWGAATGGAEFRAPCSSAHCAVPTCGHQRARSQNHTTREGEVEGKQETRSSSVVFIFHFFLLTIETLTQKKDIHNNNYVPNIQKYTHLLMYSNKLGNRLNEQRIK